MLENKSFGIIGLGHIGQALKLGLEKVGFTQVLTSNKAIDNIHVVDRSNIIFLAVRPAVACEVLEQIELALENKILISLVAGLSISLSNVDVFRLMTSLLISENMGKNIVWTGTDTNKDVKSTVDQLLTRLAATEWVESEDEVDKATLTVGAGPGWMAEIIANLDDVMLTQTLAYLQTTGISAKKLAQMVATPSGITEAMIATQDFKTKLQLSFEQGGSRMKLVKKRYHKL